MRIYLIAFLFLSLNVILSCSDSKKTEDSVTDEESCVNPTKDPNDVKPMAQMMRAMANYCDTMRVHINAGKQVDSLQFPLMPFWTVEPTDKSVLEPLFYNNAKQFAAAYRQLMSDTTQQRESYTAVINSCINCHSSFCSGPLKRIRKLTLDYSPAK